MNDGDVMRTRVIITAEHPEGWKKIVYSGLQNDGGTIARNHFRELSNRKTSMSYRLYIWDLSPYGDNIHNAPQWMKDEIRRVEREFRK